MNQKMTFEEALSRLQEITEKLESGEEGLDASLKLFEEGAKLSAFCKKKLDTAEQKVRLQLFWKKLLTPRVHPPWERPLNAPMPRWPKGC